LGAKSEAVSPATPDPQAFEAFLKEASVAKPSEAEPAGGIKLRYRESAGAADFETYSADGTLVHRSVLAR
jgi:hypothetical protein